MSGSTTAESGQSGDRVAALREEIRRAGRACVIRKRCLVIALPGALLGWVTWEFLVMDSESRFAWLVFTYFGSVTIPLLEAAGLAVLAVWIAARTRELPARRLAYRVSSVPLERWADLLEPLGDARSGEMNALLRDIATRLRRFAEVSPAAAPGSRGDEVSPAGTTPSAFSTRRDASGPREDEQ
jgi:hypothetical protein